MTTELLIYAIIAGILVFWLRNTLGTRHGEERERPNPLTQAKLNTNDAIKSSSPLDQFSDAKSLTDANDWTELPIHPNALIGLKLIAASDKNFNPKKFIAGAKDAFPLIVEAFAAEDRDLLAKLLSPDLYQSFDTAMKDRHLRGETVQTEIHAVRTADIIEAELRNRMAFITMRFQADETCIVRNAQGEILSGHPDRTTALNDVWVFGRDTRSTDPTWFLFETRDDVSESTPSIFPHTA
jgi:predicted lipid-binding transport protein (Tim44 family)